MVTQRIKTVLTIGVSIVAMLYGGTTTAQDEKKSSASIEEVVVTAQKREERLQDVPLSVTAINSDMLSKNRITSTNELASVVPGLNINQAVSGYKPFLRGVGTSTSGGGNENSIAIYLDNIYLTGMNAGLLNLSSIEAIEVLKGPQGTLFGRNATGGVIHVKTRDPVQEFGGNVSISFDDYETLIATGYVTGGLSENLAADLAVFYRDQGEGYGTNLATGNEVNKDDSYTIRGKLLFTPTEADTFLLTADYSESDGSGNAYNLWPGSNTNWGPPDATHPLPTGAPYTYPGDPWDIDHASDPFVDTWYGGLSLEYTHEFSWGLLSSFTAYRKGRINHGWNATPIPTNAQTAGWNQPEEQFSQELQLSSLPDSEVQWLLGAYYADASIEYDPFFISGLVLAPTDINFVMDQTIESPALYAQVTVPVPALGDTNITGGIRYTIDERGIVGGTIIKLQTGLPLVSEPSTVLASVNPTDASKTFKTLTWRLAIDHHFTPDMMAYISYNKGFKAGVYNTIPPPGPGAQPTNPEFLDAYEIGFKNTLFDGRATLNLAAFWYQYTDLQVTIFAQTAAVTLNAAEAEIFGLDADFTLQVNDNLRLSLGAEILDQEYTSYKNAPILTPQTIAQGGGVIRTFGDVTGNALPWASDAVVNANVFYERPTEVGVFDATINLSWNDGYVFDPSEVVKQDDFVDLNATLGWTLNNGTTRFSFFAKNLTNEKIARFFGGGANPGGYLETVYRPPRTFGFSISQEF